jgi:ankyrin repeat protein
VDLLVNAGGTSRYNQPGIIDTILDRVDNLQDCLNSNPQLINQHLPDLDFGSTGGRRLLLNGATLLHVAAEYGSVNVAKYLLERGADVNTRADVNHAGIGGQTPVFHAATQFDGCGLPMTRLLLEYGADLDLRVKLPGHYERPDEVVECTPLEYALLFPGDESPGSNAEIVKLLRERQR